MSLVTKKYRFDDLYKSLSIGNRLFTMNTRITYYQNYQLSSILGTCKTLSVNGVIQ